MGAFAIVAFFLLTSTQMFLMTFASQVAIGVLCVLEEANEYLEGKRELEEVTEHIQSRVRLLLKENR